MTPFIQNCLQLDWLLFVHLNHRHLREIDCSLAVVGGPATACIHGAAYNAKHVLWVVGNVTTTINRGKPGQWAVFIFRCLWLISFWVLRNKFILPKVNKEYSIIVEVWTPSYQTIPVLVFHFANLHLPALKCVRFSAFQRQFLFKRLKFKYCFHFKLTLN